jgi:pimeloyl-ACP methyl ester carboxylesterase
VPDEDWARVYSAFGPNLPDQRRRALVPKNLALNSHGMELIRRCDIVDQLDHIDTQTLVVVGELDPVTPQDGAEEILGALPEGMGELEVLEDGGHFHWLDVPDRFWPMLIEFVEDPTRANQSRHER